MGIESALSLMGNHISYECGHKIVATVGMIESVHDGMDMRYCPDCRKAVNAAKQRANAVLLERANCAKTDGYAYACKGDMDKARACYIKASIFIMAIKGEEMPLDCVLCDTGGSASCLVGACPI